MQVHPPSTVAPAELHRRSQGHLEDHGSNHLSSSPLPASASSWREVLRGTLIQATPVSPDHLQLHTHAFILRFQWLSFRRNPIVIDATPAKNSTQSRSSRLMEENKQLPVPHHITIKCLAHPVHDMYPEQDASKARFGPVAAEVGPQAQGEGKLVGHSASGIAEHVHESWLWS